MSILVVTIEHAGTKETLRDLGWRDDGKGRTVCPLEEEDRQPNAEIFFCHVYPHLLPLIQEAATRMKVYTTERPAEDIRNTWKRNKREQQLHMLDEQLGVYDEVLKLNPHVVTLGARP